jgi:acetyl-CoA carboxylase carboxyl transferase subunit beta
MRNALAWSKIEKAPIAKSEKIDTPDGLWQLCRKCSEVIFRKDFEANQNVCPKCQFHFPLPAPERIRYFLDPDSFVESDSKLTSNDPLGFIDSVPYKKRLADTIKKTGRCDALIAGAGLLKGRPVNIAVFDFRFMGGSMGSVVGEKITRVFLKSAESKHPAVVFSASGGARMQEGLLSLMQMAKTCTALSYMKDAGVPLVSVMTDPTTGGVAASYAMLGDVNIGEPGALIGFAGPRVIQQTIGQSLPEGFQRSEYLLEHGMLDLICHRDTLRDKISQILTILLPVDARKT